ncbi:unnamed protein product [Pedinophyceae sp. YPF-701]|nr:unnamed protein product [Pedinophyceae sp. YPF-701]
MCCSSDRAVPPAARLAGPPERGVRTSRVHADSEVSFRSRHTGLASPGPVCALRTHCHQGGAPAARLGTMATLTREQEDLYDRQLGVWGVEAQKKMSASKVMLVGTDGLTAEVAKNITLAGIGSVILCSSGTVADCSPCNFLVAGAQPEARPCDAMAAVLSDMNPFVKFETLHKAPAELGEGDLTGLALVVLMSSSWAEVQHIAALARRLSVPFSWGYCRGGTGVLFNDFLTYDFLDEWQNGEDKVTKPRTLEYAPLDEALSTPLSRRNRRALPAYGALRASYAAFRRSGAELCAASLPVVKAERDRICAEDGVPEQRVPDDALEALQGIGRDVAPVCTVVGGVLGNDVIRVAGRKGLPVHNLFTYNVADGKGRTELHPIRK